MAKSVCPSQMSEIYSGDNVLTVPEFFVSESLGGAWLREMLGSSTEFDPVLDSFVYAEQCRYRARSAGSPDCLQRRARGKYYCTAHAITDAASMLQHEAVVRQAPKSSAGFAPFPPLFVHHQEKIELKLNASMEPLLLSYLGEREVDPILHVSVHKSQCRFSAAVKALTSDSPHAAPASSADISSPSSDVNATVVSSSSAYPSSPPVSACVLPRAVGKPFCVAHARFCAHEMNTYCAEQQARPSQFRQSLAVFALKCASLKDAAVARIGKMRLRALGRVLFGGRDTVDCATATSTVSAASAAGVTVVVAADVGVNTDAAGAVAAPATNASASAPRAAGH